MYIGYSELPINVVAFRRDPDWAFLLLPYSIKIAFSVLVAKLFPLYYRF